MTIFELTRENKGGKRSEKAKGEKTMEDKQRKEEKCRITRSKDRTGNKMKPKRKKSK